MNSPRPVRPASVSADQSVRSVALQGALSAATRSAHPSKTTKGPPLRSRTFAGHPITVQTKHGVQTNGVSSPSSESSSPGWVAARQAAARSPVHSGVSWNTTSSSMVSKPQSDRQPRSYSEDEIQRDILPVPGTVTGAKSLFEALEADKLPKQDGISPPRQDSKRSQPALSSGTQPKSKPGSRLPLSIDISIEPVKTLSQAQGIATEIHSPKPRRPNSGVATFEAAAAASTAGPSSIKHSISNGSASDTAADILASPTQEQTRGNATSFEPFSGVEKHTSDKPPIKRRPQVRQRSNSWTPTIQTQKRSTPTPISTPSSANVDGSERRQIESLANAIVASALASSRAPSPAKPQIAPPLPRRETDQYWYSLTQRQLKADRDTPSPKKTMLKTMRKPPSPLGKEPEPSHHGRSHIFRNPHKHHEGTRKRWRDEITEDERKRYEGLWAANRDLYITLDEHERRSAEAVEAAKNCVSGLVVKDIWSRSHLPHNVLEEIWELVDRNMEGRLARDSFVVGTWLVDQRLKGKKLPPKVQDSVWHSARGIYGLKVPKNKH